MMTKTTQPNSWILGADPACDVWVNEPTVSSRHCELTRTKDGFAIRDLNSSNGTFVNGRKVSDAAIAPGDDVRLGDRVLMPWPDASMASRVVSIGAAPDNQVRLGHRSVSGHHANLIVDPNDQLVLQDRDSTNGTWVDDVRVRMAVLRPGSHVRIGSVTTSAQEIVNRSGARNSHAPYVALAGVAAATILATLLLISALILSWPDQDADDVSTDRLARTGGATDHQLVDAGGQIESSGKPSVAFGGTGLYSVSDIDERTDDVVKKVESNDDPVTGVDESRLSRDERFERSLFILVVSKAGNEFDFASAWAIAPERLITNAHVVESLRENRYEAYAVHLASGQRREIVSAEVHDSYVAFKNQWKQASVEVDERLKAINASASGVLSKAADDATIEEIATRKKELPWLMRSADAFDAARIEIDSPVNSCVPLKLSGAPILPRRQLWLGGTSIEYDSAFYNAEIRRTPSIFHLQAVRLVPQQTGELPMRWVCNLQKGFDSWPFFLHDGSPILDIRGRVVGMYRGPTRALDRDEQPTSDAIPEIDMVPIKVIETIANAPYRETQP